MVVNIHGQCNPELVEVVAANNGMRTSFRVRDCQKKQGSQNAQDGNYDEQFDQRKCLWVRAVFGQMSFRNTMPWHVYWTGTLGNRYAMTFAEPATQS